MGVHGCAYSLSSEPNTFLGVENGSLQHMSEPVRMKILIIRKSTVRTTNLPHKGLNSSSTTIDLVESNLSNNL